MTTKEETGEEIEEEIEVTEEEKEEEVTDNKEMDNKHKDLLPEANTANKLNQLQNFNFKEKIPDLKLLSVKIKH